MAFSFIVAAALLVFGQSAQSASLDAIPAQSCLTIANEVATKLQSATDLVAGKPITLDVIGGTVGIAAFVAENEAVFAKVNLSGSIVILASWCDLSALDKDIAMAHEIGHVIDMANDPMRLFLQLPFLVFLPWNDRPPEQRANEYARQILIRYNGQRQSLPNAL